MKIEYQWFLEGFFFKTIQSEENSFQVPRSFKIEERSKTG